MSATYRTGQEPRAGDRVTFPVKEIMGVPGDGPRLVEVRREGVLVSAFPEYGHCVCAYPVLEMIGEGGTRECRYVRVAFQTTELAQCEKCV